MSEITNNFIIESFKDFIRHNNYSQSIVLTFYEFRFPSLNEHSELFNTIKRIASIQKSDYKICILSEDQERIKWVRKLFPKFGRNIIQVEHHKKFLNDLFNEGFEHISIVYRDQIQKDQFRDLYESMNGIRSESNEYFLFRKIDYLEQKKSYVDTKHLTESIIRNGDFELFKNTCIPPGFIEGKDLFNYLRSSIGLNEIHDLRQKDIVIPKVSDKREQYSRGELFSVGERVCCIKDNKYYLIERLGANYVEVISEQDQTRSKKWINDLSAV